MVKCAGEWKKKINPRHACGKYPVNRRDYLGEGYKQVNSDPGIWQLYLMIKQANMHLGKQKNNLIEKDSQLKM